MEEPPDVASLVAGLISDSESSRKYAVFKLKGELGDPSFADSFIDAKGLPALRQAVLDTTGNTQAYALGSLVALLELDLGWECCDAEVLEQVLLLAISHSLVNVVRNALALLVLVVSRPCGLNEGDGSHAYGFRALKPALENHPEFLVSLVQDLSALDHTLCANALQLVNALLRDAVLNGGDQEWPRFIKRLQDLGMIGAVGMLMRGDAAIDAGSPLASAILEFQGLTRVLLKKWRDVVVNVELHEHKRALKTINLLSKPVPYNPPQAANGTKQKKHHPEKWRRLGFETESPAWEFDETGYLGMMDLVEYCWRHEDTYVKTLMEQSVLPQSLRCPLARASLGVTLTLYEHFEIHTVSDLELSGRRDDRKFTEKDVDKLYKPLLLQWGRLHAAALNAFLRLWKDACAEQNDFYKIEELIRIVVEHVLSHASRKTEVSRIEEELRLVSVETARLWQMKNIHGVYQDAWGPHLSRVREQLHHESLQFMKEQRIRCLLQGSWFPNQANTPASTASPSWRFVRLSHNRRWLHYQNYSAKGEDEVPLVDLAEKVDLSLVTSVDSDVLTSSEQQATAQLKDGSVETLKESAREPGSATTTTTTTMTTTKITILGSTLKSRNIKGESEVERVLLELCPQTSHAASEWLDGLLMLLNQQPITKDTTRLIEMMVDWGVRLRLLNLRWEDVDWEALEMNIKCDDTDHKPVPSRDGVNNDYYYALPDEVTA